MSDWQNRAFGNTDLKVSALGLGAGQVGSHALSENEAAKLLNSVLDLGITLIDTARGYNLSEERIGRYLRNRRHEYVLSTKVGYDIPGYEDWTGPTVTAGIDAALSRLQTDYIDIVHLHSCDLEVLQRGEVISALQAAVKAGKVRVAAYSGENEALEWAVTAKDSAGQLYFQSIQTSINFCDQRGIDGPVAKAIAQGLGVIAKRPIANAPWRYSELPVGEYVEEYWKRAKAMNLNPAPFDWEDLALRFSAYLPGVSSCIVGTASTEHLSKNLEIVKRGPLPTEKVEEIRQAFRAHDQNWVGQV